MINNYKLLGILNIVDNCSYLNNEVRRLIRAARMNTLEDFPVQRILERLHTIARSSDNPAEKAEILLHCAVVGHQRRWLPQSARDANEAVTAYENDEHRRAVASWILGTTQWDLSQNQDAYTSWAETRKIFKQRQKLMQRLPGEEAWYQGWISQMEIELVAHPEEIANWLVVNPVQEKIKRQSYPSIYVLMQDLHEAIRRSEEVYERAEIHFWFGLAVFQMGNIHFAMELLRKAVLNFYPGLGCFHKQVVARCMLGAIEWFQDRSQNQAAADWMRCVDEFEKLRSWADRDNIPNKEKWYAERCDILRTALLKRVEPQKAPSGPGNKSPKPLGD